MDKILADRKVVPMVGSLGAKKVEMMADTAVANLVDSTDYEMV